MDQTPSDIKGAVERQFTQAAANYSTSQVHVSGQDLTAMLDNADLPASAMVLDAGCGAGHTALAFAAKAAQVIAYDLSGAMLAQVEKLAAEKGIANVTTRQGDVENLPFEDNTFEGVTARYTSHHWPNPATAAAEIARVLKPGCSFLLSDIVASPDATEDTFLQTIELLRDPSHVRDYSVEQWTSLLQAAGLQVESLLEFALPLDFKAWLTRINTPAANAAMIKSLWAGAPDAIRAYFQLPDDFHERYTDDFSFTIYGAVLRATKPLK